MHVEALFKDPPPPEDCPICFLPLPLNPGQRTFHSCCGKIICDGCLHAMDDEAIGRGKIDLCAFCRTPETTSDEENVKQTKKLMGSDNAYAFNNIAGCYAGGIMGMPKTLKRLLSCF